MADPVAAKSGFLCMYMSNHPDTLVSYVKYWGKVKEKVTSAQMVGIDTKGMDLTYISKAEKKRVRVVFEPPLSGYEEVKPRLMTMKAEAEEALGMVRAPQISDFRLTKRIFETSAMLGLLIYTTFSPRPGSPSYSSVFSPATLIQDALPSSLLKWIWGFVFVMHSLEALYTLSLCRKYRTGFFLGVAYVVSGFIWGYPVFVDIRKRVQAARIDSIMKGQ